jgi:hypothetical protein
MLKDSCGIDVVANLEKFPVDLDPSLREYHEKIAARIEAPHPTKSVSGARDRYYIHKTLPFFVGGRLRRAQGMRSPVRPARKRRPNRCDDRQLVPRSLMEFERRVVHRSTCRLDLVPKRVAGLLTRLKVDGGYRMAQS